jgi:predicted transcriptional regulator of viral defense system
MARNVGMHARRADISRYFLAADHAAERLRTAGVGAFVRPHQLGEAGLTPDQLPSLIRRRVVEQVSRGLYRILGAEPTENYSLAMACARVPNSIVCLLSALRVHGIGSQAPAQVWLGIPHKARPPRLHALQLRIVRFSGPAWTYGVKRVEFEGVPARITSPARTVADCFRHERLVGAEVAIEALRDALKRRLVTIAELSRVEEVLPSRRLRAHLEMRSI